MKMTANFGNLWISANKALTVINMFLLALIKSGLSTPTKVKDPATIKIPILLNLVLFIALATVAFLIFCLIFRT